MEQIYQITETSAEPISVQEIDVNSSACLLGVFSRQDMEKAEMLFHVPHTLLTSAFSTRSAKFESHEEMDFFALNLFDEGRPGGKVCICLRRDALLFVCSDVSEIAPEIDKLVSNAQKHVSLDLILCGAIDRLTFDGAECLMEMEQEIEALEDALLTSDKQDCVREIVSLRKRLMAVKRYYEQLLDLLDAVQENENGLIGKRALRALKILNGRADRLYHNVLNLRDYVTQVREAYQAQVDISLNKTMKLFTVITAIFLPLSLIVGWYGMNLQMPEYGWMFGYPAVIGLSAVVVLLTVLLFKKHKWF